MFYVLRFNVFFLVKSRTLCYESTFVWVLCSPNCDTKVCVAYAVLPICVNQIVEFLALELLDSIGDANFCVTIG